MNTPRISNYNWMYGLAIVLVLTGLVLAYAEPNNYVSGVLTGIGIWFARESGIRAVRTYIEEVAEYRKSQKAD